MSESTDNAFDAGAYWQDRVVSGADLSVVGHRSMGPEYNRHIYERRLEVLDEMLARHSGKPVADLRVLDIGCGSGFYTGYWAARGVRDYVGVDISAATIDSLAQRFPDYRFLHRDVTESRDSQQQLGGQFDVITVFDVFYHIVDDVRFANAVELVASAAAPSACILVMDQLFAERYQLSRHVVYRDRAQYLDTFGDCQLQLADGELLFHYLVPPLSGSRLIDVLAAGVFKIAGLVLRLSAPLASRAAAALRRLDNRMRERGRHVANSEMLVFKPSDASTGP